MNVYIYTRLFPQAAQSMDKLSVMGKKWKKKEKKKRALFPVYLKQSNSRDKAFN